MSSLMTKLQRNSARNWSITCGPFYVFSQLFALGGSKRVTKGPQRFTPLRAKFVSDKGNREPTCSSFSNPTWRFLELDLGSMPHSVIWGECWPRPLLGTGRGWGEIGAV